MDKKRFSVNDCNFCEKDDNNNLVCTLTMNYNGFGCGISTYYCSKWKCILQEILKKGKVNKNG